MRSSKKKRSNDGELTKDNFDKLEDNGVEDDPGVFEKASPGVLQKRKIVHVRRTERSESNTQPPATDGNNPFAGLSLTAMVATAADKSNRDTKTAPGAPPGEKNIPKAAGSTDPPVSAPSGVVVDSRPAMGAEATTAAIGNPEMPAEQRAEGGDDGLVPHAVPESGEECLIPPATAEDEPVIKNYGVETKRKRVEGPQDEAMKEEESPTSKKGKMDFRIESVPATAMETKTGKQVGDTFRTGASLQTPGGSGLSTPGSAFAALAASASPFKGIAASNPIFSTSSIFSAPSLNVGAGIAAAPVFGCTTGTSMTSAVTASGAEGQSESGTGSAATASGAASTGTPSGVGGFSSGPTPVKPVFSSTPQIAEASKMPGEVQVVTGEEGETTLFAAKGILYQMEGKNWKESCRGEVHLSVPKTGPARLIMRQKATLKVCLNARLYPQMTPSLMERSSGVVFHCINWVGKEEQENTEGSGVGPSEGSSDPATGESRVYAIRFVDKSDSGAGLAESLIRLVNMHKERGSSATAEGAEDKM